MRRSCSVQLKEASSTGLDSLAGEFGDGELVGHKDDRFASGRQLRQKIAQGFDSRDALGRCRVEGIEGRQDFNLTYPEQPRGFEASAPLAGIHAGALYAGLCQPAAERAGLLATNGIEIALGCAIIDPEAGRVTRTRGIRMAQHEQAPRFGKFARRKRRRHGGDGGQSQSKAREAMPHPHVGSGSA